jgi:hypothetical protein
MYEYYFWNPQSQFFTPLTVEGNVATATARSQTRKLLHAIPGTRGF